MAEKVISITFKRQGNDTEMDANDVGIRQRCEKKGHVLFQVTCLATDSLDLIFGSLENFKARLLEGNDSCRLYLSAHYEKTGPIPGVDVMAKVAWWSFSNNIKLTRIIINFCFSAGADDKFVDWGVNNNDSFLIRFCEALLKLASDDQAVPKLKSVMVAAYRCQVVMYVPGDPHFSQGKEPRRLEKLIGQTPTQRVGNLTARQDGPYSYLRPTFAKLQGETDQAHQARLADFARTLRDKSPEQLATENAINNPKKIGQFAQKEPKISPPREGERHIDLQQTYNPQDAVTYVSPTAVFKNAQIKSYVEAVLTYTLRKKIVKFNEQGGIAHISISEYTNNELLRDAVSAVEIFNTKLANTMKVRMTL